MTKILAISDRVVPEIHSPTIEEQFGDVDLVLACGDLPFHYLEFINSNLRAPLLYILGNHDQGVHTVRGGFKRAPVGGIDMDGRSIAVRGVLVAGLEGSMRYSDRGDHQYSEWDMRWKVLRLLPALWRNRLHYGRFLDILITHAPPYRIHDGRDLCHTGFKVFLWLMERYQPRYLVHGHQHVYESDAVVRSRYGRTEVVNAYGHQLLQLKATPSKGRGSAA